MPHNSSPQCDALTRDAVRLWRRDLVEIGRASLKDLLTIFDKIYEAYQVFESECFGSVTREIYDHYLTCFNIALLKLAVAIEDKVSSEGVVDDHVKSIINMFSDVEKEMLREFEKFKSLDPSVTPPEKLADYIVSKHGGIYNLVKEAMDKQYVKFGELIESWSRTEKMGNYVRRGFEILYGSRFRNIVDAIKILVEKQPAWIRRLFSEYEEVLLSSSDVRERFEQRAKEVFEDKLNNLRAYVEKLEEEKRLLLSRVEELSGRSAATEEEKRLLESQLNRLQQELQGLRGKYEEVLRSWERSLEELGNLKKQLVEKERELEELAKREKENTAAKEALEAEILRLKQLVDNYEEKVKKYEEEKEGLLLELKALEDKVSIIERTSKGEAGGRVVTADEASLLEFVFIGKLRSKLNDLPIKIRTPWGEEVIRRWDEVKEYGEKVEGRELPRNTRAVFVYEKRSFLGLGEARRIEVRGIYLSNTENLRKLGLDSTPASLSDLLRVLREVRRERLAEGRSFTLIGVASPTGWDERAVKYVLGEGAPTLFTDDMVVLLVDPLENKVYYPEELARSRPYIEGYARLFMVETSAEEEQRVEKILRDLCDEAKARSPVVPVFPYKDLEERIRVVSPISLIRVLSRYRERGAIEVRMGEKERLITCRDLG